MTPHEQRARHAEDPDAVDPAGADPGSTDSVRVDPDIVDPDNAYAPAEDPDSEHRWMGPEENPASGDQAGAPGAGSQWMGPEENPASGAGA